MPENKKETTQAVKPNYESLYKTATVKNEQLEKLCKDYAIQNEALRKALNEVQLDYNARLDYLVDCAKHAYISAQIVRANKNNIANTTNGGTTNAD